MFGIFERVRRRIVDWCVNRREIAIGDLHKYHSPVGCEIYNGDELKFIERTSIADVFVRTDRGYSRIKHSMKTVPYDVWELQTTTHMLLAADDHIVIGAAGAELAIRTLKVGDVISTDIGPEAVISVKRLERPAECMYDLHIEDDRHLYYTGGILSHNSTVSAMYLLWFAMFNEDKTILIASNKNKGAMEMISRIRFAYEELPLWLKPGVMDDMWNKHAVGFDNGSRIESTATTESSGRGMSISCVAGNTPITIRNKKTGLVEEITIAELAERLDEDPIMIVGFSNQISTSEESMVENEQDVPRSNYELDDGPLTGEQYVTIREASKASDLPPDRFTRSLFSD